MALCSKNKNPLQRSGTGQTQRLLPAMQESYVQVDENSYEDWIVFAAAFSRYLKFYAQDNQAAGDWAPFFASDISAMLGTIAIQDIDAYKRAVKVRFDFIKDDNNAADETAVKQQLNELFGILLTLSSAIDEYIQKLPAGLALKNTMQNLVKTKLVYSLQKLLAYYVAAETAFLLAPSGFTGLKVLDKVITDAGEIINGVGLGDLWWAGKASWADVIPATGDGSIFTVSSGTAYQQMNHAANHNLFVAIFNQYLTVYTTIITDAKKQLLQTLEQWDTHPAHYALFLTFLKLFATAKDHINTLRQKHLDYYYKEILRLAPKNELPNQAHILVELAKHTAGYILPQGTLLKAGKDSGGNEVLYAADKTYTFNKAAVAALKAVYVGAGNGMDDFSAVNNRYRLFASPVANSADGLGKPLTSANKEWQPFTNKQYTDGSLADIAMPLAQVGFAIATHYLYLSEGERKIIVTLTAGGSAAVLAGKKIACYLTTQKEWYQVPDDDLDDITASGSQASITFALHGDAPAITNYHAAIHGGNFNVGLPVLKVVLINEDTFPGQYHLLRTLAITTVKIDVRVGEAGGYTKNGIKQLQLSNENGPVDASKAFQPFGGQPVKDASLTIGNKEVFSKKNAFIKLNVEWANLPTTLSDINYSTKTGNYPSLTPSFLEGGIWKTSSEDPVIYPTVNIFNNTDIKVPVFVPSQPVPPNAVADYNEAYDSYNAQSRSGFFRMSLNDDFGHKDYLAGLTTYLINKSKTPEVTPNPPPVEPYVPTIQSLYLSYTASQVVNIADAGSFNNREIRFFHLYPFGEAEQHRYINQSTTQYLLPQFTWPLTGSSSNCSGEFYIGLQNLQAEQSVSILFQVLDGTTDPAIRKPEEHLQWSFLANNIWIPFKDNQVSDATRQLVQSGIISFVIPAEATTANTILAPGYLWIRASVTQAVEAVCKLVSVDAQAALLTLQPNNNAGDLFENPLPAGTIAKLKLPDAAVKKIIQPYPSFGGRAKEAPGHYYVRVSERLRHKARAITIWDYERLVLEAFPDIHKVKCLNHTQITDTIYNETQPGHVSIITIPALVNRNDINPLRPYTNANRLIEIETFLKQKISCHVSLGVHNPQFEEVRLYFLLQLAPGYDDFTVYSKLLQEEITAFLTPWAYNGTTDIQFGGKIYKSSLINFIEERVYVDFITNVEMYHRTDQDGESQNLEEITASTARSILVSAPAVAHDIKNYATAGLLVT